MRQLHDPGGAAWSGGGGDGFGFEPDTGRRRVDPRVVTLVSVLDRWLACR
jgi:hypothetical protein